jgi:hypothetical protein
LKRIAGARPEAAFSSPTARPASNARGAAKADAKNVRREKAIFFSFINITSITTKTTASTSERVFPDYKRRETQSQENSAAAPVFSCRVAGSPTRLLTINASTRI